MGKLKKGILSAPSGSVGTIQGYGWKGVETVRSSNSEALKGNFNGPDIQKVRLKTITRFAHTIPEYIKNLLKPKGVDSKRYVYKFIQWNYRFVDLNGNIDYSRLIWTTGGLNAGIITDFFTQPNSNNLRGLFQMPEIELGAFWIFFGYNETLSSWLFQNKLITQKDSSVKLINYNISKHSGETLHAWIVRMLPDSGYGSSKAGYASLVI